jgi:hypothetical protein
MKCVAKQAFTQTLCSRWLGYTKGAFPSWKLSIMPFRKSKEFSSWLCSWYLQLLCARSCPLPHSESTTILLLILTQLHFTGDSYSSRSTWLEIVEQSFHIKAPLTEGIFSSCVDRHDGRSDFLTHIMGDKSSNPAELELSYDELHSNATVLM